MSNAAFREWRLLAPKPDSRYIETVSGGRFTGYQQAIDRDFERHQHSVPIRSKTSASMRSSDIAGIPPINAKKAALAQAMMD
jgi:hypothetical protein